MKFVWVGRNNNFFLVETEIIILLYTNTIILFNLIHCRIENYDTEIQRVWLHLIKIRCGVSNARYHIKYLFSENIYIFLFVLNKPSFIWIVQHNYELENSFLLLILLKKRILKAAYIFPHSEPRISLKDIVISNIHIFYIYFLSVSYTYILNIIYIQVNYL